MPIYEYSCRLCGHQCEKIQKITENPLTLCPACEKEGLQKLISISGFRLKGEGWYATDFKDKPASASKKSEAPKESSPTSAKKKNETPAVSSE
jgi:putative FmdB family regulatory protein